MTETAKRPALRPRDAATILLLDRSDADIKVLVGKRSTRHAFMPDLYVFPGGRRDAADNRARPVAPLHPALIDDFARVDPRGTLLRWTGLAHCALRELAEETGLGAERAAHDLSALRLVARAITPPGRPRRFNTFFFAAFRDELGFHDQQPSESGELGDPRFISVLAPPPVQVPDITQCILDDIRSIIVANPSLPFGSPIPFYYERHGRDIRDLI